MMEKHIFGVIISIFIMLMLYYCIVHFFKALHIKVPFVFNYLDITKYFNHKENMQNMGSNDPLEKSIEKTQLFSKIPTGFQVENKEASFLSFLTRFDPQFKPPNYTEFPYKSTLYTVDYKCRPSATGMFTDCGPNAPNSCNA